MSTVPIAINPNQKPFFTVNNLAVPCEGSRTFPIACDWSTAPAFSLDLQNTEALKRLSMVQSVFIDNSLNDQSVSVLAVITGMTLTIKKGQQANLNIDVPNPASLVFSSTGTLKTKFQLQNFPVTNEVWDSFNSGDNGFPTVVAAINRTGETSTITFDLLDGTQKTGMYQISDYLSVITPDSGASIGYDVSWEDETGTATLSSSNGPGLNASQPGSISAIGCISFSQFQIFVTPPQTIYAVTGTPVSVTITVSLSTTLVYSYHATITWLQ